MKIKPTYFEPDQLEPILSHIDQMWDRLTVSHPKDAGSLIGLPKSYVVPSSRTARGFSFQELYYWDSYFIAQGLLGTHRQKLAEKILNDLLYLQQRYGIIPNGNRHYLMGRSQPPLLTSFIFDVYSYGRKTKLWLARAIAIAESEYMHVWVNDAHPNWRRVHKGLSRYYDVNMLHPLAEAESGWDMNPRFGGEALNYLPVDLNALLYKYEKDFERAARILGRPKDAQMWSRRASRRKAVVSELLWNERAGFFFDYDYVHGKLSPTWSLAAYFTLWSGMATQTQARRLVENLTKFQAAGGLTTTDKRSAKATKKRPLQWEYPNGWAPLQLITVRGLVKYGFREEADLAVRTWLQANIIQFNIQHAMMEKYNVVNPSHDAKPGLYPSQKGFGWSNAIFYRFSQDYLLPQELPESVRASSFMSGHKLHRLKWVAG